MPKAPGRRSKEKKWGYSCICLYFGVIHVVRNKFPILSSIERADDAQHPVLGLSRIR